MTENTQERIENIRQIKSDDLKIGGFVFQLPEGTTDEDIKAFQHTLKEAQENNLNLTLTTDVKVIDTRKQNVSEPTNTVEVSPIKEETVSKEIVAEKTPEEPAVQNVPEPVPQAQPAFVMPQQNYTVGQQPWRYDPFTGMPIQPAPTPPPAQQQPQYQPQPAYPANQQIPYGHPGFYYPPPPPPSEPTKTA